jgi:hypothetical protein
MVPCPLETFWCRLPRIRPLEPGHFDSVDEIVTDAVVRLGYAHRASRRPPAAATAQNPTWSSAFAAFARTSTPCLLTGEWRWRA